MQKIASGQAMFGRWLSTTRHDPTASGVLNSDMAANANAPTSLAMDNIPPGIWIYRQWRSWWPILVIALSVVQAGLLLNAQSGAHLRTYSNLVNFLHLLLLLLAAGLATRNALGSRRAIRLFWSLVALGCVFWALSSLSWIYYVAIRSQDHPAFLFEAFPLHFLLIFMIAAVASRPHLHFARHGPYRTTLNLLLLLFLWVFAYAFALLPISHLQVGAKLSGARKSSTWRRASCCLGWWQRSWLAPGHRGGRSTDNSLVLPLFTHSALLPRPGRWLAE